MNLERWEFYAWRVSPGTPWSKFHIVDRRGNSGMLCEAPKPTKCVGVSTRAYHLNVAEHDVCGGCRREVLFQEDAERRRTMKAQA